MIADAQLVATQPANLGGAQVAFMNPGGIRADIRTGDMSSGGEAPGEVIYGEAFTVQPFGNSLVTRTMTGDMLRRLLEQQFPGCGGQAAPRTSTPWWQRSPPPSQPASRCRPWTGSSPPPPPERGRALPAGPRGPAGRRRRRGPGQRSAVWWRARVRRVERP
jgi:hypothetical protein